MFGIFLFLSFDVFSCYFHYYIFLFTMVFVGMFGICWKVVVFFFFATNAMEHVGTECMGSVTECMIPGMGARYFMECFGGFGSFENFNDF